MKKKNPLRNRKKIAITLYAFSFFLFFLFSARFTVIMLKGQINGEDLSQNVSNMYTRSSILQAERGPIFDVNGNPLALDATSYKLIAVLTDKWSTDKENPQYVVEKESTAKVLSQYISMSEEDILAYLSKKEVAQVEFGTAGNNLTFHTKNKIENEELPGIIFEELPTRLYPNGMFASHLIGLAQVSQPKEEDRLSEPVLEGVFGIEKAYDEILKGTDGELKYKKNRFGYALPNETTKLVQPVNGSELYLTFDKKMQSYMESVLTDVQNVHDPKAVTATLMNAKTGAIIAASQRPSFDATSKEGLDQTWQNYLTEYSYEPGSTIKALALAAAVEENVFQPEEEFLSGKVKVDGGTVRDVNPDGWGTISYREGVARSSNVAFVNMIDAMGTEKWKTYLDKYGFGQSTNSGLLNEVSGSNTFTSPLQKTSTAFGQGISVTVLQMMKAFSALTNEGQMVQPYFIDKIVDGKTGETAHTQPVYYPSPISKETALKTLEYLKEPVYSEYGTAKHYQVEGFELAAKTGTAQLVDSETGKYYSGDGNYIYSVVGFAPAEDPELILYVTVQQPHLVEGATYGGAVVQKLFNPILKRALTLYTEDNSDEAENHGEETHVPNVAGLHREDALNKLAEASFDVSIIGTGDEIVQQLPQGNLLSSTNQRVILMTNGAQIMPDLTGWSKTDVLRASEITGITFMIEGEGFVTSQSVSPGSSMLSEEIKVVLTSQNAHKSKQDTSIDEAENDVE